jgi:hypothetical protein
MNADKTDYLNKKLTLKTNTLAPITVKSPEYRWLTFYVLAKRPTEALANT